MAKFSCVILGVLLFTVCFDSLNACSCMPEHPQVQFCRSDFAIVATVRRMARSRFENIYRLKIRKELKMSEKSKVALKAGRLFTPKGEEMCGISLRLNNTYLITGQIIKLQARVNLCNFVEPWRNVTPRQRKGFRMLYKQGCPCKIQPCFSNQSCAKQQKSVCKWANPYGRESCHADHGICMINNDGQCHWAKAPRLTMCLRQSMFQRRDSSFN